MNESGRAVRPLMDYFNLTTEDIIICHDDMDLEIGHLRLRQKDLLVDTMELSLLFHMWGLKNLRESV